MPVILSMIIISFFYRNFPNRSSTKNCWIWFDLEKAIYGNAIIEFLVSMSLILSVIRKTLVVFKCEKYFVLNSIIFSELGWEENCGN